MNLTSCYFLAGYILFFLYRASTWHYNQDVVKVATVLHLKDNWSSGQLYSKRYLRVVRICYLRYLALLCVAINNWQVALGCLIFEAVAKYVYYVFNVNKKVKVKSLLEMFYALEYNRMKNCSNIKDFSFTNDMALELILEDFKSRFIDVDNYEVFWVKDHKGEHIVQVIGETYSSRSAYKVGNLNLIGQTEVLIDGKACMLGARVLHRLREVKKEKGIVEVYSIESYVGLDVVDF